MKQEDIKTLTVSSKVLEDLFGVSDRTIRYLADEGIVERVSHGKYRFVNSVKSYITALKVASKEQTAEFEGEEIDLFTEKAVHERYKRQITEIKLQLIQGKVHKAEDIEAVMTDMLLRFKAKLEGIPSKLAPKLENESKVNIQRILTEEISDALMELSEYSPAMFYSDEHIDIKDDNVKTILSEIENEEGS